MHSRISFVGTILIFILIFLSYYVHVDHTNPEVQFYSKRVQNDISKDVRIYQNNFSHAIDDLYVNPNTLSKSSMLNKGKMIHVFMFTLLIILILLYLLVKLKCNL